MPGKLIPDLRAPLDDHGGGPVPKGAGALSGLPPILPA